MIFSFEVSIFVIQKNAVNPIMAINPNIVTLSQAKKKLFTVNDLTSSSCRWPIVDPKDEDFHFYGKESLPDKPYCAEHAAIAYVSAKIMK